MHKKFEINWTKIKAGCQSGRKVVTHNSKSDLPLFRIGFCSKIYFFTSEIGMSQFLKAVTAMGKGVVLNNHRHKWRTFMQNASSFPFCCCHNFEICNSNN